MTIRLAAYDFASPGGFAPDSGGLYFAFASGGDLALMGSGAADIVAEGGGRFLPPDAVLRGSGWLFGITPAGAALLPSSVAAIELTATIALEAGAGHILRADAVTSPSGAATPRHGHRGPGIRRLLKGLLLAEVGAYSKRIRAGDAWFESGDEWVVGTNISDADNIFIRVMVLPQELKGGKSSFVPASPEEGRKVRAVRYHLFGEIDLPALLAS